LLYRCVDHRFVLIFCKNFCQSTEKLLAINFGRLAYNFVNLCHKVNLKGQLKESILGQLGQFQYLSLLDNLYVQKVELFDLFEQSVFFDGQEKHLVVGSFVVVVPVQHVFNRVEDVFIKYSGYDL